MSALVIDMASIAKSTLEKCRLEAEMAAFTKGMWLGQDLANSKHDERRMSLENWHHIGGKLTKEQFEDAMRFYGLEPV